MRNNPKLMVFRDDDIVNHLHNLARHTRIYKLGGPGFSATRAFYYISFSPLDGADDLGRNGNSPVCFKWDVTN